MAKFWNFIKNEPTEGEESSADLLLYGEIASSTWWGDEITPKQFADDLAALGDVSTIHLRINSPGGDVFAASAIYNLLKAHKAKVVTHVDGLAASAASVIAIAGDEVIMPGNAMMMVHNPWTYMAGDARDMRKMADTLDTVRDTIIASYQAKTGMERQALINLMNSETWLTAEQAKEYGFADTVAEPVKVAASVWPGRFKVNNQDMDFSAMKVWPGALLASAEGVETASGEPTPDEPGEPEPEGTEPEPTSGEPEASAEPEPAGSEPEPPADTEPVPEDPVAQDRARMQAIDEIAAKVPGSEALANKAKYEEPMTAEQFAVAVLNSSDLKNAGLLALRRQGAPRVPAANVDATGGENKSAQAKAISDKIKEMRGIK